MTLKKKKKKTDNDSERALSNCINYTNIVINEKLIAVLVIE